MTDKHIDEAKKDVERLRSMVPDGDGDRLARNIIQALERQQDNTPAESDYEAMNQAWLSAPRTEEHDRYIVGFAEGIQAGRRQRVPEEHVKAARRCLYAMSGSSTEKATIERVLDALAAAPEPDGIEDIGAALKDVGTGMRDDD